MPVTRSQAHKASHSDEFGEDSDDDQTNADLGSDNETFEVTPVPPPSGIDYDTSGLSPTTESRFTSAWPRNYQVEECGVFLESKDQKEQEYIAVHVQEKTTSPYTLRFGPPGGRFEDWRCTCWEIRPCSHLVWLMDQLMKAVVTPETREKKHVMTRKGYSEGQPDPYAQLKGVGMKRLRDDLGWRVKSMRRYSDSSEPRLPLADHKMAEAREILSTFSSAESVDQFRPDLSVANIPLDLHHGNVLVPGDLEATMLRLLVFDPVSYNRLKLVVSEDQKYVVENTKGRVRRWLDNAATIVHNMESFVPSNERRCDVQWAAHELLEIVVKISKLPAGFASTNTVLKEVVIRAMLTILAIVIDHHEDMYAGDLWNGTAQQVAPLAQHSLFHYLIGSPQPRLEAPFLPTIIQQVREYADVASSFVNVLQDQLAKMKKPGLGVPSRTIVTLENTITELRSGPASGVKRLGEDNSAEALHPPKRMK